MSLLEERLELDLLEVRLRWTGEETLSMLREEC